jgi:hypothetical protein
MLDYYPGGHLAGCFIRGTPLTEEEAHLLVPEIVL